MRETLLRRFRKTIQSGLEGSNPGPTRAVASGVIHAVTITVRFPDGYIIVTDNIDELVPDHTEEKAF
jgi:hypothetical protein